MIESLLDTLGLSTASSVGTSLSAIIDGAMFSDDIAEAGATLVASTSLVPTTSTSLSILDEKTNIEKAYENVEAITYIESCSNDEVNDMLNQIDELLDNKQTPEDIKALTKRI
jgi:hypothetical protein